MLPVVICTMLPNEAFAQDPDVCSCLRAAGYCRHQWTAYTGRAMASCTGSQQLAEQVWITREAYCNLLVQVRLGPIYLSQQPFISL